MNDVEQKILKILEKNIPELDETSQARLLGMAEGIEMAKKLKEQEKTTA